MKKVHNIIAIMCTPHTPRLVNITAMVIIASSIFCTISKSQEYNYITIPPEDTLAHSLKLYHNRLWMSEREEFLNLSKKKWWYYLPTVGLQFGLPSVQFGTGTLAVIDRDKISRNQKLKSIDLRRKTDFNDQLTALHSKYAILKIRAARIKTLKVIRDRKRELFDIYLESWSKKDITPEEFKIKELSFFESDLAFDTYRDQVLVEALELFAFCHLNEEQKPVWFDIDECEVLHRVE